MNIIKCVIRGQALTVLTPLMADLTVNYFNVEADFSREWDNGPYGVLTKHVHIHRKDNPNIGSDWSLDFDNKLASTNGINLDAGTWEIWFSSAIVDGETGNTLWRLTTEVKTFEVVETGTGGGYMPDIPESNVDQITAIAQQALDVAQSVRDDADAGEFDGAPGPQGPQGPPGNYTKPATGIPKSDLSESVQASLDKADTALQEHQSLAAYRTSAEQDVIDNGKADKVQNATSGNFAGLDASGNLTDSGHKSNDYAASDLGITGASVGDMVRITAVDANGKPTAFDRISDQNNNIAIVQNTNTATRNITKNQYVIWNGELYIASAAIASGATLSNSNLTAVENGGLNALAFFTPGNRYTFGFFGSAFVTDGATSLTLSFTTGKNILRNPTIESLKFAARGVSGYIDIFNSVQVEAIGNTNFTVTVTSGIGFIAVKLLKNSALSNAPNNTPATVNGTITFLA